MDFLNPAVATVGLVVGLLVGLTGVGGAALMTPILILGMGVKPVMAVGTDLVFNAVTKVFGSWQHGRQGSVDWKLAARLASGSIPGALAGIGLLVWLRHLGFSHDVLVSRALGAVLVLASLAMLLRLKSRSPQLSGLAAFGKHKPLLWAVGAVLGFAVGLTSVGSGSLFIVLLTLGLGLPAARAVGTDIFHALLLTAVAGAAHLALGNVDLALAGNLLLGSIPGVLIASRLSIRLPERVTKGVIGFALLIVGFRLI